MSNETLGIIVGGLIPAALLGISNLFSKASAQQGLLAGGYLMSVGLTVTALGILICWYFSEPQVAAKGYVFGSLGGLFWGLAIACLLIALSRYGIPISKATPLFNMNTLVTVILGLWIFSEWKDANVAKLVAGSALVVAGGVLVGTS